LYQLSERRHGDRTCLSVFAVSLSAFKRPPSAAGCRCRHGTGVIVPPLAASKPTMLRFEDAYIEGRRLSLETFLR